MAKKYTSTGGYFLEIEERGRIFRLVWRAGERFSYVSGWTPDSSLDESDEDRKSTWEILTASAAAKPFSVREGSLGFEFESLDQARLALSAANASLLQGGVFLPYLAIKAAAKGKTLPRIPVKGRVLDRVDGGVVADALGAEPAAALGWAGTTSDETNGQ